MPPRAVARRGLGEWRRDWLEWHRDYDDLTAIVVIGQERGDEMLRGQARGEGAGPDVGFQAGGDRLEFAVVAEAIKELVPD